MMLTLFCGLLSAQAQTKQITGTVTDEAGQPLPGVTVMVEGTTSGTITDLDGKYQITVPNGAKLVFSFIGYENVTMVATNNLKVTMSENTKEIDEVVVVGYGQQKKASVVGAITQANAEVLQRTTGVSDLGTALTGNLPGLVTIQSTGMPGSENPSMIIRGSSSWNSSDPLVLVDGIERPMSSVDISSVESISVLKDASATAIYGVKGANGVVIITTKRGKEGRAQINVSGSTTLKVVSKLPGKLDSYDALMATNRAIEHELNLNPDSWKDMNSQEFINNYRYRDANATDEFGNLLTERYPNVDWQDYLFKNYATAQTANVSVMGGSKVVRYFSSVDYAHEGDLFKDFENARGYKSGYNYNRVNVRSNLDFNITKYTVLKTNLAGSAAIQRTPWSNSGYSSMGDWQLSQQWAGAYNIAPDVFMPRYADGSWGANLDPVTSGYSNATNSAANVGLGGNQRKTTTNIATDLILEQDLKFVTEGLSFTGMVSWDNRFEETGRGINDLYHNPRYKSIDPKTGIVYYDPADNKEKSNEFDYTDPIAWSTGDGQLNSWSTFRRFNYQFRLNYDKTIGKHNFTVMGLFERQENTSGSDIPARRENWAFRVTYNWNSKYFAEYNGAYNGSEKFSEDNRFAFFNSGAIGWTISQESFMDNLRESGIINNLKLRMSYGEIGDDNVYKRWLYASTWALG
ncbi:MAG: SusC/RagA family TonB-linked outer membrane protein, partial [Bacteroidales bacterium]|nr:SusC/RagA family TonB-linked outer membrane protein [Bacteroidales bacterium]